MSPVMHFLDILTVDEYVAAKDHPTFRALTGGLDHEKIMKVAIDAKKLTCRHGLNNWPLNVN
jgi:hypothetical protein